MSVYKKISSFGFWFFSILTIQWICHKSHFTLNVCFHLSRLLKKIDKERQKKLKQERRMLKNGGYAAICRLKRETEEKTLEIQDDLSDLLEKRNDGLRLVIFELFLQIS